MVYNFHLPTWTEKMECMKSQPKERKNWDSRMNELENKETIKKTDKNGLLNKPVRYMDTS